MISLSLCHRSLAGTYTNGFTVLGAGAQVYGSARLDGGMLKLTNGTNDETGALVINDLDSGRLVNSLTAKFKLGIGGGTGSRGASFNFAQDLPDASFGDEGAGNGLSVLFDTSADGGSDATSIGIKFRGTTLASAKLNPRTGTNFVNVTINVQPTGTINVLFGTNVVHTNVYGYFPIAGRFGFGARTSDPTDQHVVDDLSIATTQQTAPFVAAVSPVGPNAPANGVVTIRLEDYQTEVNTNSVRLSLNSQNVTATVSKLGGTTSISYDPPGLLEAGSTNRLRLIFSDRSTPAVTVTNQYEFVVENYAAIAANFAVARSLVTLANSGFRVRTVQARANAGLESTVARAEAQLAGTLIDPASGTPYRNEAKPGPNTDGTYDEEGTINYEQEGSPVGNFTEGEKRIPGIPGSGGHTDSIAMEAIAYLEIPAGYHKFGVTSDEGFKVTLARDVRDVFATVIGVFDGSRRSGESVFSFVTETNGFYPCRLVWFEGGGAANVEFYSITENGTRILINDRNNTNSIKAYRPTDALAQTPPYVQSVSPAPDATGISRKPLVNVVLKDAQSRVATNSIQLSLNGQRLSPTITKAGDATTLSFQVQNLLDASSINSLSLSYSDNAAPANTVNRRWTFTTARVAKPTGQWDFEAGNLRASVGADLEYGDGSGGIIAGLTTFGTTTSFGIPDIGGKSANVMKYGRPLDPAPMNPGYIVKHGIPSNGGGIKVNQWTLIMDMLYPEPQEGGFSSLFETEEPTSGGDLFVRWNSVAGPGTGGIGVSGQYTGNGRTQLKVGQWHRIAIAVDLTATPPVIGKFIDGIKFQDQGLTAPQVDGRFALSQSLRLFADDDNEVNTFYVNSVQILDGKLTDDEIAALGGPSASGIPLPVVRPRLSVSQSASGYTISWPESSPAVVLESSDSLSSPTWTAVTGVKNNSVTVPADRPARFFRLRAP